MLWGNTRMMKIFFPPDRQVVNLLVGGLTCFHLHSTLLAITSGL